MRRTRIAAAVAALACTLAACSGSDDDAKPGASATSATTDPRDPVMEEIEALPAVDLDDLEIPDAPDGSAQADTDAYAAQLIDLMKSSLDDERWWSAEPTKEVMAAFLRDLPRETREQALGSEYANDGAPVAQYMVSIFDEDAQPVGKPRVVKATWLTEPFVPEGSEVRLQRVRLGVYAVYRVGKDEDPVLVRRELSLNGANASDPASWPGLGYYTYIDGIDNCALYDDGTYTPLANPGPDAVEPLRTWLADAEKEGWTPLAPEDTSGEDPSGKRQDACADRTAS